MKKTVVITGGTGFIGSHLINGLRRSNYEAVILTRHRDNSESHRDGITYVQWDGHHAGNWVDSLENAYAVINLAGENIFSGLWTEKRKKRILESRVHAGEALTFAAEKVTNKPEIFIQASAIDFYGSHDDEWLDETAPSGESFLSLVTREWEASTKAISAQGIRRKIIRIGLVLGKDGGMIPVARLPFKLFMGGTPGNGNQWFSWIHIEDLVEAILFLLESDTEETVYNLTAPNPLPAGDFFSIMGKIMHRPVWVPAPSFLIKTLLGELGEVMLLSGQRVAPKNIQDAGFIFKYETAYEALRQIFSPR